MVNSIITNSIAVNFFIFYTITITVKNSDDDDLATRRKKDCKINNLIFFAIKSFAVTLHGLKVS